MTLGMSLETFTIVHVLISLVGIGSGLVVAFGLLGGKRMDGVTALFLAMFRLPCSGPPQWPPCVSRIARF